jgi:hypothetical protein
MAEPLIATASAQKTCNAIGELIGTAGVHPADHRRQDVASLRLPGQRPARRRAAAERDELAPIHFLPPFFVTPPGGWLVGNAEIVAEGHGTLDWPGTLHSSKHASRSFLPKRCSA